MYLLNTFYSCKAWRSLLDVIKNKRTNDDGNIICEFCGKPIVKSYDIIGHHKIELTEDNVNDFDISLNEDNVMLVHLGCHNEIHNKLNKNNRNVYIIYGAPCSGKSTYINTVKKIGDLIIDVDSIWQCVSGCEQYIKPNKLKPIVFNVRDTLIDNVKYRLGFWNNAYIIGGYPLQSERERLVKELRAREVFIECTKEECLKRLHDNPNGRNVDDWSKYISDWFDLYS